LKAKRFRQAEMGAGVARETRSRGSGAVNVSVFGLSDIGRVRKNNEDSFVVCDLSTGEMNPFRPEHSLGRQGLLLLVADGMGGETCGEVASNLCAEAIPKRLIENLNPADDSNLTNLPRHLQDAVEFANHIVFEKAQCEDLCRGMGTTATAAAVVGDRLVVAQVGDSRAYLIRNGRLFQLTRDQTFLNYLAERGAPLPPEPEKDSRRSILTQAVGTSKTLNVKLTGARLRAEDSVLVCSDGLYSMVKPAEVLEALEEGATPQSMCKALVDAANARGGSDNVTVIVARVSGSGLPPVDPDAGVEVDHQSPTPEP
jgi:serine/threonine protein phosphatase PrpC